ncbi:hypothetical protein AVEN_61000-1 [Araneus ventricosus]|uniref:Uncharacterized protein n=1 Tax=Araneus ventricosus TaxID=182803 RepID=A0A4Y2DBL8_ARAVE|nr:hypothetical protein AVEN_61000-1 [Araneus ventricosus]
MTRTTPELAYPSSNFLTPHAGGAALSPVVLSRPYTLLGPELRPAPIQTRELNLPRQGLRVNEEFNVDERLSSSEKYRQPNISDFQWPVIDRAREESISKAF